MANKKRHKSMLARAQEVKAVTAEHYEPENLSRCYSAVWRRWIYPRFGISFRTYQRYLQKRDAEPQEVQTPSLFDHEDGVITARPGRRL